MERAPQDLMIRMISRIFVLGTALAGLAWALPAARANSIAINNQTEVAYYSQGSPYSVGGDYWGAPEIGYRPTTRRRATSRRSTTATARRRSRSSSTPASTAAPIRPTRAPTASRSMAPTSSSSPAADRACRCRARPSTTMPSRSVSRGGDDGGYSTGGAVPVQHDRRGPVVERLQDLEPGVGPESDRQPRRVSITAANTRPRAPSRAAGRASAA